MLLKLSLISASDLSPSYLLMRRISGAWYLYPDGAKNVQLGVIC